MTWTDALMTFLRWWTPPKRPPIKPARSLAELEAALAMAKKRHQARRHIEAAMQEIRNAGLRRETRGH